MGGAVILQPGQQPAWQGSSLVCEASGQLW